jgi:hypothetical protein
MGTNMRWIETIANGHRAPGDQRPPGSIGRTSCSSSCMRAKLILCKPCSPLRVVWYQGQHRRGGTSCVRSGTRRWLMGASDLNVRPRHAPPFSRLKRPQPRGERGQRAHAHARVLQQSPTPMTVAKKSAHGQASRSWWTPDAPRQLLEPN